MKGQGLLFAVALAVRAAVLFELRDSVFFEVLLGDGEGYERAARGLLASGWRSSEAFYQAPLYPYFLAAVHAVIGPDLLAVRAVQALLGAASCLWLADAAGRFFGGRVGALSGWLLAFYAPAIYYDVTIEKTALGLFLFTAFLSLLARAQQELTLRRALSLGLAIGALSVLRENLIALGGVVAIWIGCGARGGRARLVGACFVGLAAVQAPFVLYNWSVSGTFAASAHFGPNLYIGNSARADGLYVPLTPGRGSWEREREDARTLAEADLGRPLAPGEVSRYWTGRALEWIGSHPLAWTRLTLRKLHYTFHSREWMDSVSYEVVRRESLLLTGLGLVMRFGFLVPLAAVGLWLSWSSRPRPLLLYACIALVTASVVTFFVFARYRFTLVPLLLPFAALALDARGSWIPQRWKTGAALLAATLALVHAPVPVREHPRADTYSNVAGALLDRGEPERARALLQPIVALEPGYALPHLNLGKALIALDRLEEARRTLEEAAVFDRGRAALFELELGRVDALQGDLDAAYARFEAARARDPLLPDAHASLGLLYARSGRPEAAESAYREALRLRPGYAAAHNDLGYLLQLGGRFEEASAHYERALRSEPDHPQALPNLAWLRSAAPVGDVRDGPRARALAERYLALAGENDSGALDLLAAARAESGDFAAALTAARRARELASDRERIRALDARIAGYEREVPYRY